MIKKTAPIADLDMVPQAIFARSIYYFTATPYEGADDLDQFEGAAFALDNDVHFCLRRYHGHPEHSVTLYLEYAIGSVETIDSIIRRALSAFELSASAVLWQRGHDYEFGRIKVSTERLTEREARLLTLKIIASQSGHAATTTFIKGQIPKYFPLTELDSSPYPSRGQEPRWKQIVGNVVSHNSGTRSIFTVGYAVKTRDGKIQLTQDGADYLNKLGFAVA